MLKQNLPYYKGAWADNESFQIKEGVTTTIIILQFSDLACTIVLIA